MPVAESGTACGRGPSVLARAMARQHPCAIASSAPVSGHEQRFAAVAERYAVRLSAKSAELVNRITFFWPRPCFFCRGASSLFSRHESSLRVSSKVSRKLRPKLRRTFLGATELTSFRAEFGIEGVEAGRGLRHAGIRRANHEPLGSNGAAFARQAVGFAWRDRTVTVEGANCRIDRFEPCAWRDDTSGIQPAIA